MARPTPKMYDDTVQAFLKAGYADYKTVGAKVGQTTAYARRAWERGWPPKKVTDYPMPPIKTVLENEVLAARSARALATRKLMARHNQMLTLANDDAAQQRAIEGMAVRSVLVVSDALAREMVQFTTLAPKLQAKINELVNQAIDDPDFSLQQLQQLITWATNNLDVLTKAVERAQSLERKYMGEADTTIRIIDSRTAEDKASTLVQTLMALHESRRLSLTPDPDKVIAGMGKGEALKAMPVIDLTADFGTNK